MEKKDTFYKAVVSKINKYSIVVRKQDNKEVELYFSRYSNITDSEKNKILETLAPNDIIAFAGKESGGRWYIDSIKKIIKSEQQEQGQQIQHAQTELTEPTEEKTNISALDQQKQTQQQITKDNYWEKKLEIDIEKLKIEFEKLSQERQNKLEMRRMSAFNRATEIIVAMEESKNMASIELLEQVRLLAKQIEHDIVSGIDIAQGIIPDVKKRLSQSQSQPQSQQEQKVTQNFF